MAYEGWNWSSRVDPARHFCLRTLSSINITASLQPFQPLPSGTYGTNGTLAFKHRLVFLREQANYDLFVCQEDDAVVAPHHLSYFLRWSAWFNGTDFYPGRAPEALLRGRGD